MFSLFSVNYIGIQREEDKIKKSLKDAAKKGQKDVCQIYAKEIVRSKKAINRIYTTKANINSVIYQMKNQECMYQYLLALHILVHILLKSYPLEH